MIRFHHDICSDLDRARGKEWLETNGLGGFASSTIIGMNARRYHGLLVAAIRPPVDRMVLLSKLEERLFVGDRQYALSTNQYPAAIHPKGYLWQTEFRLDPMPTFTYAVEDLAIEKSVFMVHGKNSTAVSYRLLTGPREDVLLELRPLIAFRDYHALAHANSDLNRQIQRGDGWISVTPYPTLPTLYLNHTGGELLPDADWYLRFEYEEERQRGLDWEEDLFSPCALRFQLSSGAVNLIASTEVQGPTSLENLRAQELRRRARLLQGWEGSDPLEQSLLRAADQFIVTRGEDLETVIAGYHWFTDWGRDTMISLPGLTLVPRRYEEAKKILLTFAHYCNRGLLPNRFPDAGEQPEYNTVDATLWFIHAIHGLAKHTGDYAFVRKHLYSTLLDVIDWHLRGTQYNIRVTDDGLLNCGQSGVQLTWMDAKVGGEVVTPRIGKPVEIQALWYNALRVVEHLARKFGDQENERKCASLAARAKRSFNDLFWNSTAGCLFDFIDGDQRDPSIRPNQILAVSLPFSMLSREKMRSVVQLVTSDLLTPFGLRSLSPADPEYRGHYDGDQTNRDRAYHEGTVWAWLMGPYITARVRAAGGTRRARRAAAVLLTGFREHLSDAGLASVSEIFDGDPPHAPKGCIAQAWSVAEVLRAAVEDLAEPPRARSPNKREAGKISAFKRRNRKHPT